ncbi:hypothetical protein [Pseudogemmobacter faecipullorum]|uniref:Uncharacterized protein n=1 Tax=Pseudogemmobacter faecipullorum TaxID=2755041 RepID=A0ABS8CST9_9RHOB|nr:hypothetical protein [Pseudogemmobacter faecipullorum]MCB5412424.1 hypothetical protein [Pseudogemmobacter faecipullorum]
MSQGSQETTPLQTGDEIRIIYRGNGRYSAQLHRQPQHGTNIALLFGAASYTIEELSELMKGQF